MYIMDKIALLIIIVYLSVALYWHHHSYQEHTEPQTIPYRISYDDEGAGDITISNTAEWYHVESVTFILNDGTIKEYTDEDWQTIKVTIQ